MKIFILRHGEAEHLLEDWRKKVSYGGFVETLLRWENTGLTEKGKEQIEAISSKLLGTYDVVFSSPLKRTLETTQIVNKSNRQIFYEEDLTEILIYPPLFLRNYTLSINTWISICVIKSLFDGNLIKILKQAKELYHLFINSGSKNILVVSHSARIHSLLFYVHFDSLLEKLKKDISPSGLSIVEFKLEMSKINQKNRILNVNE